jgi:hypothetical protein
MGHPGHGDPVALEQRPRHIEERLVIVNHHA